ncbi:MAG TPA: nuclear transport factor 2 family protein [Acidobacteriaceae bacterium]|nr:nuclear transport factor 2 family protein [Acidobacteriaceae bacterium]
MLSRRLVPIALAATLGTVFFVTVPAVSQNPDPLFTATRQQLDVVKIILAQQNAWNKGDLDAYLSHYKDGPDTQAVLANLVRGVDNIRSAYKQNFPNKDSMGTIEDTDIEVEALGDNYALATGKYHLNRPKKSGGPIEGTFMELFEKTQAGWQIIFSQSS